MRAESPHQALTRRCYHSFSLGLSSLASDAGKTINHSSTGSHRDAGWVMEISVEKMGIYSIRESAGKSNLGCTPEHTSRRKKFAQGVEFRW